MANITGYYNPQVTGLLGRDTGTTPWSGPLSSVLAQPQTLSGLPQGGYLPRGATSGAPNFSMGPLSQLAYQMAGSPKLGPFADRGTPPATGNYGPQVAGASGPGTGSSTAQEALTAAGLLARSPALIHAVGGLFGSGASAAIPEAGASDASMLAAYGGGAAAPAATAAADAIPEAGASDAAMLSAYGSPELSTVTPTASYVGADTGTSAAAGSDAASGSSGVLGAAAGPAALAALAYYAYNTPAYTLQQPYYDRVNDTFNKTVAAGIKDPQFMANYDELTGGGVGLKADSEQGSHAAILSPQQQQQLQSMYQQYLATYMPWITGQPPSGPLGNPARGGHGTTQSR